MRFQEAPQRSSQLRCCCSSLAKSHTGPQPCVTPPDLLLRLNCFFRFILKPVVSTRHYKHYSLQSIRWYKKRRRNRQNKKESTGFFCAHHQTIIITTNINEHELLQQKSIARMMGVQISQDNKLIRRDPVLAFASEHDFPVRFS